MSSVSPLEITLACIGIVVWLFVYIPLIMYHGLKYYRKRNHMVYRARYCKITLYEIIFMSTKLVYACFYNTFLIISTRSGLTNQIFNIFNWLITYCILYCWVWRFWLIFYEITCINSVITHSWKTIINTSLNYSDCWYIKNKKRFGNFKYIRKIMIIFVIICWVCSAFADIYVRLIYKGKHVYFAQMIGSFPYVTPFILLMIIYYRIPIFVDNFYVTIEMKYIFLLLCVDYIAYYTELTYLALGNPSTILASVTNTIAYHIVIGSQVGGLFIATYWVNKKVKQIINQNKFNQLSLNSIKSKKSSLHSKHLDMVLISIKPQKQIESDQSIPNKLPLLTVLGHNAFFDAFMHHLSYEFSIECLLSLVE